jgi:hypothetical protein
MAFRIHRSDKQRDVGRRGCKPRYFRPCVEWLENRRLLSGTRPYAGTASQLYGQLALSFEPNQGQLDRQFQFASEGNGYALSLAPTEALLNWGSRAPAGLHMHLVNGNAQAQGVPLDPLPGKNNYYLGSNPDEWFTDVPSYGRAMFHDVYPGIDVTYYGNQGQLEYDFTVAGGADPGQIVLKFEGASGMEVNQAGDLVLHTSGGDVVERAPLIYQENEAGRQIIPGAYLIQADHTARFQVGAYDPGKALVIDPKLEYSHDLPGDVSTMSDINFPGKIAVDADGHAFVTGQTIDAAGHHVAYVAELSLDGTEFLYRTLISAVSGGDPDVAAGSIAVDSQGNAYAALFNSTGRLLPFTNRIHGPGAKDGIGSVLKLDANGDIVYLTDIGGSEDLPDRLFHNTLVLGVAVDDSGDACITGQTSVPDFPTVNALQGGGSGTMQPFVAKLNPSGSGFIFSTYLGADGAIAVDGAGNTYVGGGSLVSKLDPTGQQLLYSTQVVGSLHGVINSIAVDAAGDAYVTGTATSANRLPNAFVAKISPDGSKLLYSRSLGGNGGNAPGGGDFGMGIAVDPAGNAYVTGSTTSNDFPTTANAFQPKHDADSFDGANGPIFLFDAFVTKLSADGSSLSYSSYLGGKGFEYGEGIAVDPSGIAYVLSSAVSPEGANEPDFIAKISGEGLKVTAQPIAATRNEPFSGVVATFTSTAPDIKAERFSATIDWGDGTAVADADGISQPGGPGTPFLISGSHTYAQAGAFPVIVTVNDPLNSAFTSTIANLSQGPDNESSGSIAVDPSNPLRLFAVSSNFSTEKGRNGILASYSTDGGITWQFSDPGDHLIADGNDNLIAAYGLPKAAFDESGTLFVTYQAATLDGFAVAMSEDGGKTFVPLAGFTTGDAGGGGSVSTPVLATGPGDGPDTQSVWVAYKNKLTDRIEVLHASGAAGASGALAEFTKEQVGDSAGSASDVSVAVGPEGQALVAYLVPSVVPNQDAILTSLDANDGSQPAGFRSSHLAAVTNVTGLYYIPAQQSGSAGITSLPSLAWDLSDGPHRGRVYLVYTDVPSTDAIAIDTTIELRYSDDSGNTWSNEVFVGGAPERESAFLPSIAVDQQTGDVAVSWYDAGPPADSRLTVVKAVVSNDGGQTFPLPTFVTSLTSNVFDPQLNDVGLAVQRGEYAGLAFSRGFLYPTWVDNNLAYNDNPSQSQFELLAARVAVAHVAKPRPKVTAFALTGTEGQPVSGLVATFTSSVTRLTPDKFKASIDWGDGTPEGIDDQITQPGGAGSEFQVFANHTYAHAGTYPVVVTVEDTVDGTSGTAIVNLSQSPDNESSGTIAVDPSNPLHVFAASNSFAGDDSHSSGILAAYSDDGGTTWQFSDAVDHLIADGDDGLPTASGFPQAAFDRFGNLYLTYEDTEANTFTILFSTDGGKTFNEIGSFGNAEGTPILATGPGNTPDTENVWVALTTHAGNKVGVLHASVTGAIGATTPTFAAADVPDSTGSSTDVSLAIGPEGQVLAAYRVAGVLAGKDAILTSLDPNDTPAAAFGASHLVTVTNVTGLYPIPAQKTGITSLPSLAWDRSQGPHRGRVYLVYTDAPSAGATNTLIQLRYSDDNGTTWSKPVTVLPPEGSESQFLPTIAVDSENGDVAVSWYDTYTDADSVRTTRLVTTSNNGGASFAVGVALSTGESDATDGRLASAGQEVQYGEYAGLAFVQGLLHAVWADNSAELDNNPAPPQFDLAGADLGASRVEDAPLTPTAVPVKAFKDKTFTGVVASFTDVNPNGSADDFSAQIDWGDGNMSEGEVQASKNGGFDVVGINKYTKEQMFSVKVSIQDNGGSTATITSPATVVNAISAAGGDIQVDQGEPFTKTVASFTDADPSATPPDFSAQITWGDGLVSAGRIVPDGQGGYDIIGSHTYFRVGSFPVTIVIKDVHGPSDQATATATVVSPVRASVPAISVIADESFTDPVADFTVANPSANAADFTAQIDWGDGQPVSSGTVQSDGQGGFNVDATHIYAVAGSDQLTITIQGTNGASAVVTGTATVRPALVGMNNPTPIVALQDIRTGEVELVSFSVQGPVGMASAYSATIDWNDGSLTSSGDITLAGATVQVSGNHTYAAAGMFHPVVTLDNGTGASGLANCTVEVRREVTSQVRAVSSGLVYNPQTQLFNGKITLTNISTTNIIGPIPVLFVGLPTGVSLANASGTAGNGDPFVTDPATQLPPGQSQDVAVQFGDPSSVTITYTLRVFDPPPAGVNNSVQSVSVVDPSLVADSGDGLSSVGGTLVGHGYGGYASADGRYVVFQSSAHNLAPLTASPAYAGNNLPEQVYVRDTQTGATTLVSINQAGTAGGNGNSSYPSITPDGRFVVFTSAAKDLVSGFTNNETFGTEVFVRDLQQGATILVSVSSDGKGTGNGVSGATSLLTKPEISPDGRYVLFTSAATNLVPANAGGQFELFLRDLQAGTTTLVSVNQQGTNGGNGTVNYFTMTPDSRYVAFVDTATDLVSNDALGGPQVFLRDLQSATTTLVSVSADGSNALNADSGARPIISNDGRFIAFGSLSGALGNTVYRRDMQLGTTTFCAVLPNGTLTSANSGFDMSADGRHVTFDVFSLVDATVNVYMRDMQTQTSSLVSVDSSGVGGARNATAGGVPEISADGRYVVFQSDATNLVTNGAVGGLQLFVRDLQAGTTRLVTLNQNGTDGGDNDVRNEQAGIALFQAAITLDGAHVVFQSASDNLVPRDTNENVDLFERDLGRQTTTLVSFRDPTLPVLIGNGSDESVEPSVSDDGRFVAFKSNSDNLTTATYMPGSPGATDNIFVRDLQQGTTQLVNINLAGTGPGTRPPFGSKGAGADFPLISGNGRFVLFVSQAQDLVTTPIPAAVPEIFERDLQAGTTSLVTVDQQGTGGIAAANDLLGVSSDGRFVLFESDATNLVSNNSLGGMQLFVRDMIAGITNLVSVNRDGTDGTAIQGGTGPSLGNYFGNAVISADGRLVAFASSAPNLVNNDTVGGQQLFVRDLQASTTSLISVNSTGTDGGNAVSATPQISADGNTIVFVSGASNLLASPANGGLFARNLRTGTTSLVSVDGAGNDILGYSPSISADGRYVAFNSSPLSVALPGGVFVRDLMLGKTQLVSVTTTGSSGGVSTSPPRISANGRFVVWDSSVKNLVPNDTVGGNQVFLRDLQTQTTTMISARSDGTDGGGNASQLTTPSVEPLPAISADGGTVVFTSSASDLVANKFDSTLGTYAYQRPAPAPQTDEPLPATGSHATVTEGVPLTGTLATFNDTDFQGALSDFSAAVDWGDGTTSSGTITADPTTAGQFDVSATKTYADEGSFPLTVTVTDKDSNAPTSVSAIPGTAPGGSVLYHVLVDTSALSTTTGFLAFQFNPGAIPDSQAATLTVSNFANTGGTLAGSPAFMGSASGSLGSTLQLANGAVLNQAKQALTYGTSLRFDITLSGPAVSQPSNGLFSNIFALQLLGADGTTPRLTTDADGAVLTIDLKPDASTTATSLLANTGPSQTVVTGEVTALDAALSAKGTNISAAEGATVSEVVATFTDANPAATTADFRADITWGDGSGTQGIVMNDPKSGFDVLGTHTYTEGGSYPVAVTIADKGGATTVAYDTALITDAALTGTGLTLQLSEGQVFTGAVASFSDTESTVGTKTYTAAISWGDGMSSPGTVSTTGSGFNVTGSHAYAEGGTYQITVTVSDGAGIATIQAGADVSDPAISARGIALTATEGTPLSGVIASFTDADVSALPGEYSALVAWGDGIVTRGTISADPSGGFDVSGDHTYSEGGAYAVTTTIQDQGGSSASAGASVVVSDAQLTAEGISINPTEGSTFAGAVASFTDPDPDASVGEYTATIMWGDGTSSSGAMVVSPNGTFIVNGVHTYREAGALALGVQITDAGGNNANVDANATVADAALAVAVPGIQATPGTLFSGFVTSFRDSNALSSSSDFAASISWGDGATSAGRIFAGVDGTFNVQGTHTYDQAGTLPIRVDIRDIGGATATAMGNAMVAIATIPGGLTASPGPIQSADTGTPVTFSGIFADTGNPRPHTFQWTAQDSNGQVIASAVKQDFSFIPPAAGVYLVNFTVSNDAGVSNTSQTFVAANETTTTLTGTGIDVHGFEYTALTDVAVASFSSTGTGFTAQIDWGDGTSSPGQVIQTGGSGSVQGTHTYLDEGVFPITVTVAGNEVSASFSANATMQEELLPDGRQGSLHQRFVTEVYRDLFHRPIDPLGLGTWPVMLDQGASLFQVLQLIQSSVPGLENYTDQVEALYHQYLHRASDPVGRANAVQFLLHGGTQEQLAQEIIGSPEYLQQASNDNDRFIGALYQDVLGRNGEGAGMAFWHQALAAGMSRDQVALQFLHSDEYLANLVRGYYANFLDREADANGMAFFMAALHNGSSDEQIIAAFLSSPEYDNKIVQGRF